MKVKGWKTVGFGALVAVLGLLESNEVTSLVAQYPGTVTTIIGLVIMGLRFLTTSAIFKNK